MTQRLLRLFWTRHTRGLVLWWLRWFCPVRRGRTMFVSWNGAHYNCNPRAIAEALAGDEDTARHFELNYAFLHPEDFPEVPSQVHKVVLGSLEYYRLLASAQFIVSNVRFAGANFPYKKRQQRYIQTMHGGHGIKRVEFDVELPEDYMRCAVEDTRRTALMLSDSRYWTQIYRSAFRYRGEVLEQGLPRNDVFFADAASRQQVRRRVLDYTHLSDDVRLLLYTPTFRVNGRRDVYGFDVDRVVAALESRFGGVWHVLVSSHPNMRDYYREIYDFSHPRLVDVGAYPELQDLLVAGDALITDYSSAEMDFSLTRRPIFQLIRDLADYDRGCYIHPRQLPFPFAATDDELMRNIETFDPAQYEAALDRFNREEIGLNETGHAAEAVVRWMKDKINE